MNLKHYHVNVNLMEKNVIQSKSEVTRNVDMSVKIWKNIVCTKKSLFGILLRVAVKMVNF